MASAPLFAQYSPLFTSGLLSDSSPASSRAPSPDHYSKSRTKRAPHDSLPLTVNSGSFSVYAPFVAQESSEDAIYLTLKPSRRLIEEGRSFLSLDLADPRRTMSLRRKDTAATIHGRSVPTSPVSAAPSVPRLYSHGRRRGSREANNLPSPKPVPSVSLPEVPRRRNRPSDLNLTLSTYFSEAGPSSPTGRHRATHSEPLIMSPPLRSSPILSPGEAHAYFMFTSTVATPSTPPLTGSSDASASTPLPVEPVSAPPHITSSLRTSPSCRSTASVATRQRNRSAALAALEGRNGRRRPSIKRPRNFMSMSDDEDDEEALEIEKQLLGVLDEEEDVVVPPTDRVSSRESRSKRVSVSSDVKRNRRSTLDSLFSPLTNFIDLKDDDSSNTRGWRSFVELA